MDSAAELNRLRWRCTRRALLEMDLLLGEFLDKHYAELAPEQQKVFAELADMEDHDLWPMVTGKRECSDPQQAEIVAMLRNVRVK